MAAKSSENLLNNIIGQLSGVKRMIREEKDCLDILTQMKAARSAMDSLMLKFSQNQLGECINSSGKIKNRAKLDKLMAEIIKK